MSLATDYWVRRLRPFAAQGFTRGWLDKYTVTLVQDVSGTRASLHRPGSDLLVELEEEQWARYNGTARVDADLLAHLMSGPESDGGVEEGAPG